MTSTILTLTELLASPVPGPDPGRCYLCGRETTVGHREPPSDNFTAWASVYSGSVICEYCYPVLRDRRFRSRSWLATRDGVRFTEPGEGKSWIREVLLDPPEPPFALYLTRGGKRQGWLTLIRYVSWSRERYWVGTDWLERPVQLDRCWVHQVAPLAARLRERKVPVASMLSGSFPPHVWKQALRGGWTSPLYRKLGRRAENVLGRHYLGRLVPQLAREGYDLAFVALRAEESVRRRLRLSKGRSLGPIRECWPLAEWRWLDVWAYLVTNEWPYLSLYDQRATLMGYDPEFADVGNESIDNVLHWRWRNEFSASPKS